MREESDGIAEIAGRSRGTPRIANRLLRRVRDYAQVKGDGTITKAVTDEALLMLEVDRLGLDKMDTMLLLTLIDKFAGGPVGVETLAAAIGEEKDTIEDVYEPFLIQAGFIQRTPRGRVATALAFESFWPATKRRRRPTIHETAELVLTVLMPWPRKRDARVRLMDGFGKTLIYLGLLLVIVGVIVYRWPASCPGSAICRATFPFNATASRSIFRSPLAS